MPLHLELARAQRFYEVGLVQVNAAVASGGNLSATATFRVTKAKAPTIIANNQSTNNVGATANITNNAVDGFLTYHSATGGTADASFRDAWSADSDL